MKQLRIQSLTGNDTRGIMTAFPTAATLSYSTLSLSSSTPLSRLGSAVLSAALFLFLLLAFVPSGNVVTMAEAATTTMAPTTTPTVVDCPSLYARDQRAYFFGSVATAPYASSSPYLDHPQQYVGSSGMFMSLRGGVTINCPSSMIGTSQTGKGRFLFVLYSSEPDFDKAFPYRVTVQNTAFTYTNAPSGDDWGNLRIGHRR